MSIAGRRADRLGHEIRVVLAELIAREVKDPRIGFATVTRVAMTADLYHARAFVSVLGSPEEQQSSIEGLSSATGFLRHEIGHRLSLRRVPELDFILDLGAEAGEKHRKTVAAATQERQSLRVIPALGVECNDRARNAKLEMG